MKKFILLISLLLLSTPAFADVSVSVTASGAWPTVGDSHVNSIYFNIVNNGQKPITLQSLSSPSGTVSLYTSMQHELNTPMQPLQSVIIAPGELVSFVQNHNCIMLENPKSPLKVGDTVNLTLNFDEGSTTVGIPVLPVSGGRALPVPTPKNGGN